MAPDKNDVYYFLHQLLRECFNFLLKVWINDKGQLISKRFVGVLNSPKKRTKKINLHYYDTSGQLVFVRFLGELKTLKSPFKIN
jgi:hypothetical protein